MLFWPPTPLGSILPSISEKRGQSSQGSQLLLLIKIRGKSTPPNTFGCQGLTQYKVLYYEMLIWPPTPWGSILPSIYDKRGQNSQKPQALFLIRIHGYNNVYGTNIHSNKSKVLTQYNVSCYPPPRSLCYLTNIPPLSVSSTI